MICYHHNDLDGRCAAAIVLRKYPDCRMREIDYKDDPDFRNELQQENEKVFIVDFSFDPERMTDLFRHTDPNNVTWIDHHKTAMEYEYFVDDHKIALAGIRQEGKAGCVLTWGYLFPGEPVPWPVKWIGDRDVWTWEYGADTKFFTAGMFLEETDPYNGDVWDHLLNTKAQYFNTFMQRIRAQGELVIKNRAMYSKAVHKRLGYSVQFENFNCYVVNLPMASTEDFGEEYENHAICMSITWDGSRWTVSLRSNFTDVSLIAKKYGGGGHKGAAGFICKKLPFMEG